MSRLLPRYPVYVPSKGRASAPRTIRFLLRDEVPFRVVVEAEEAEDYAAAAGEERVLVLPFSGRGTVVPARNWIKAHAEAEGHARHWQIDDNVAQVRRWNRGQRVPCRAGFALRSVEDFADRYENVPLAGLNYTMFGVAPDAPPFYLNAHVYSCSLVRNGDSYRWRGVYNEDTDYCLQVLAAGECTILVNAFLVDKARTMAVRGGNTRELYERDDGRLKMARALERAWPKVVETRRRFQRPQHVVKHAWKRFDNALVPREGVELPSDPERGSRLIAVREVRSPALRRLLEEVGR